MKTTTFFACLIGFCFTQVQAQENGCVLQAKKVDSLVVANDFNKAFDAWKQVAKCQDESLYRNGEKILTYKLSTKLSPEDKTRYETDLVQLYGDYDRYFPGNKNSNIVKKAMFLYKKDSNNPQVFESLDRAFTKDRENFSDAAAMQIYFDLFIAQVKSEKDQSMTDFKIIRTRDEILQRLGQLLAETGNKDYSLVSESIRRTAKPIATCETLEKYYAKEIGFKANENTAWFQMVSENLADDCPRSKLYYDVASKWYALAPDAKSAYHLAQASVQQRKRAEASKYYRHAAEAETDATQKAEILYTLAAMEIGNPNESAELLRQSLKAKPDFGKGALLLAEVYASTDCGNNAFEKKARYLLAAQTARRAGALDASLKKASESRAAQYEKLAPSANEIKSAKMNGKTITFGCGINESVTLPQ
ncbi:hypothetical protein FLLO111716_05305 [Flavobacterium longum]|uniref:hypothetical protein n=1 Tax=Flavobacterium longum TaxID=1299340 RepID=UPI0039EC4FF3